jgi:3-isopropylmalate/(R)-2-methylmalate dehydratase small subunit
MEAFKIYTGTTVPIMNNNIDTDQLIPKGYLKRTSKVGFGEFLFDEWRYNDDRTENPEFQLNKPEYKNATILITGDNFGSGSSREHAAWALTDYGFRAVVAGSYSDIFYMNATKNGLLPIVLPLDEREYLANLKPTEQIIIDLPKQLIKVADEVFKFDIDATWKNKLVNGLDDIATTLKLDDLITKYEEEKVPAYWK